METRDIIGWTPFRVVNINSEPVVEWVRLNNSTFRDPIFHLTVLKHFQENPGSQVIQTDLNWLLKVSKAVKGLSPDGFIFHMSKSGSTLVSKTFAALAENLVISEADPVNTVIQLLKRGVSETLCVMLLQALVNLLGQKR